MEENRELELYRRKAEALLQEIGANIEALKARSARVNMDMKIELNNKIRQLEEQRENAREKLKQIRASSRDALGDLKTGAEMALTDLKESVDSVFDRFRL